MTRKILVSDFDGTVTRHDFYRLVLERLIPEGTPDFWSEYRAGRLTHFDALNAVFGAAVSDESKLLEIARAMEPDPLLKTSVERLGANGWKVAIASAGSRWYIEKLLAEAGVELKVHASPGTIVDGRLVMRRDTLSPVYSFETGIDKAAVVRSAIKQAESVAFAGDGYPDLPAALLVLPNLRFATAALAAELTRLEEPFHPFRRWSEIADRLIADEVNA